MDSRNHRPADVACAAKSDLGRHVDVSICLLVSYFRVLRMKWYRTAHSCLHKEEASEAKWREECSRPRG